jgi:DNA-binding CsgD family transcriptional regulator
LNRVALVPAQGIVSHDFLPDVQRSSRRNPAQVRDGIEGENFVIRQPDEDRVALMQLLGYLSEGILIVSASGGVIHETPTLLRLLAENAERTRVRREMLHAARRIATLPCGSSGHSFYLPAVKAPTSHRLTTAHARYRVNAIYASRGATWPEPVVFVTLEQLRLRPLSDEQLKVEFCLTKREIEVARLVERGMSVRAIARHMGLSLHTVRHHAEHLRMKFGVEHLAEVGAKMRG